MAEIFSLRDVVQKWSARFVFTKSALAGLRAIVDSPHRAEALDSLFSAITRKDLHLVSPIPNKANMFLARILLGARDSASHIASSSVLKMIVEFEQSRNIYTVRAVDIAPL